MKVTMVAALGALTALSIFSAPAHSAAEGDVGAIRCVDLRQIDHTVVVDDQNILFYMRDGGIYLNTLKHRAPGLDKNQPFMYRTSMSRICNGDIITVLERWGFGLTQGAASALGKFMPTDEVTAEAMTSGEPANVEAEPVD